MPINCQGYVKVQDLLHHRHLQAYNVEDVKRVVANNNKNRFTLRNYLGVLEICANQGHSIKTIDTSNLTPILNPENIEVIHGTYFKNWVSIRQQGLKCMSRNHIHFATGLPTDRAVISGMRKNCQIYIYINLALALQEGILFYKSTNDVILSPGNQDGVLSPKYFLKVFNRVGNRLL